MPASPADGWCEKGTFLYSHGSFNPLPFKAYCYKILLSSAAAYRTLFANSFQLSCCQAAQQIAFSGVLLLFSAA
jgi:hypothetical protein